MAHAQAKRTPTPKRHGRPSKKPRKLCPYLKHPYKPAHIEPGMMRYCADPQCCTACPAALECIRVSQTHLRGSAWLCTLIYIPLWLVQDPKKLKAHPVL
ncbi:hypothetical protein K445DRAFT_258351 [Daldinia sp. EC12]|nr:hypothetical protein K445DRAFT_258351 [Daldinia sp. EC12]